MQIIYQKVKNSYHKPITLIRKPDNMLKFVTPKPVKNNKFDLIIVLDRSGSMSSIKNETVASLNAQISKFKEECLNSHLEGNLSIVTFNEYITWDMVETSLNKAQDIDSGSYVPAGNTALYDAIGQAILSSAPKLASRKMILVITDGQENQSRFQSRDNIESMLSKLDESTTIAACVPPNSKYMMVSLGIPEGNVTEWEASAKGVVELTSSVTRGTSSLFRAYNSGATQTASYFQPDLNNLPKAVVASNLEEVTSKFQIHLHVPGGSIRDVVKTMTLKDYRVGSSFYQLTKKETVQDYKDIILCEKSSGKLFTGEHVRSLLRLPQGGTIELNPASSQDYGIFIRSTSWNRRIMPGTSILVKK